MSATHARDNPQTSSHKEYIEVPVTPTPKSNPVTTQILAGRDDGHQTHVVPTNQGDIVNQKTPEPIGNQTPVGSVSSQRQELADPDKVNRVHPNLLSSALPPEEAEANIPVNRSGINPAPVKQEGTSPSVSAPLLTTDIWDDADAELLDVSVELPCHRIYRIGNLDIPLLREQVAQPVSKKPPGSGFVHATLRIGRKHEAMAFICIDTGADYTVCTSQFLIHHFGPDSLACIDSSAVRPTDIKSATGHSLKQMGTLKVEMSLGTYCFKAKVLVYKHDAVTFLLGNDCIYGRITYHQGQMISFHDRDHPPLKVQYFRPLRHAVTINRCSIDPHTSSFVPVTVSNPHGLSGQHILLSPTRGSNDDRQDDFSQYLVDAVATVHPDGTAMAWVENTGDDPIDIAPGALIAEISVVTDHVPSVTQTKASRILRSRGNQADDNAWARDAFLSLKDKLPITVKVNWDQLNEGPPVNDPGGPQDAEALPSGTVNLILDKYERAQFLDGDCTEFPTPIAHELSDLPSDPDNSEWIEKIDHSHLTDDQWGQLKALIVKKSQAFAKHKGEIGCYNGFRVQLPLKPGTGYLYSKPRPLNEKHKALANEHITELLQQGIVRPSKSPHATNVVIVSKKSGPGEPPKSRMCVDLREVNLHSVPSRFPNTSVEESLKRIQGAKYRSGFDFNQAFHQLVLDEESIPITAFYVNNILYEYVRLPFGHVAAMQIYCSLMALLCHALPNACYYADDLMVVSPDDHTRSPDDLFKSHLDDIEVMLDRVISAGLKLSAHKCQWAYDSSRPMDWLGFTLANNLLKPQEAKIKAIREYPRPTSAKQALSFVSLASFYRRFINNFAKIAQPLYEVGRLDKKEPFSWTDSAEEAFEKLKEALCSTDAVLRLPRPDEPFSIYTDASWGSLGCVLCQVDPKDGKLHPCAYASRKFNNQEVNYSTPLKELLAILYSLNIWAAYIGCRKTIILSDCKAWTFLKAQSSNSNKVSRHAVMLQEYDIDIKYVPGPKNKAADGLSRMHDTGEIRCDNLLANKDPLFELMGAPQLAEGQQVSKEVYLQLCEAYLETIWPKLVAKYNERLAELGRPPLDASQVFQCTAYDDEPDNDDTKSLSPSQGSLKDLERSTQTLLFSEFQHPYRHICLDDPTSDHGSDDIKGSNDSLHLYENGEVNFLSINDSVFSKEAFLELQLQDDFCLSKLQGIKAKAADVANAGYFVRKRILMRHMSTKDGFRFDVVCVPASIVKSLLDSTHGSLLVGHFGATRYLLNMKSRYYWPGMSKDILEFHKKCVPCQLNDKHPVRYQAGQTIKPQYPNSIVFIDLVTGLPLSTDGYKFLLMVYDGFSRFAVAIPLKRETADHVVRELMTHYVARYGMPSHIHSDNGRNVDSSLIRHLCLMLGCLKTSTPPYNPRSNSAETICGAVVQLIRKGLTDSDQAYWPSSLPFILNAYNATVHTATGFTPNSLFLGRYKEPSPVPLVPFDCPAATVNEYYRQLRRFQELSFEIVKARNERLSQIRRDQMNKNAVAATYKIGDYVLVKNLQPGKGPGMTKLRAKYLGPYRIIKVYNTSLALVPWSLNPQLEHFYRDPNLFRLLHRGDVPTFRVQIAAFKDCKPYRGPTVNQPIVDPIILAQFLDNLELDNQPELIAVVDPEGPDEARGVPPPPPDSGTSSSSTQSDHDDRPDQQRAVRPSNCPEGSQSNCSSCPPSTLASNISETKTDNARRNFNRRTNLSDSPLPSETTRTSVVLRNWWQDFNVSVGSSDHTPPPPGMNQDLPAGDDPTPIVSGEDQDPGSDEPLSLDPRHRGLLLQYRARADQRRQRLDQAQNDLTEIRNDLRKVKKDVATSQRGNIDLEDLEWLVASPDPQVREKARREFLSRLDQLEEDVVVQSPTSSDSSGEATMVAREAGSSRSPRTPLMRSEADLKKEFLRVERNLYRDYQGMSRKPLSAILRHHVEVELDEAKAKLARARQRSGLPFREPSTDSGSESEADPDDWPGTSEAEPERPKSAPSHPAGESPSQAPPPEEVGPPMRPVDAVTDPASEGERPNVLQGPQPGNRFDSQSRPYAGPADAIRRWLEEGEQAEGHEGQSEPAAEVNPSTPQYTRTGRRVKPRETYSPDRERAREQELRAKARAEAQRKAKDDTVSEADPLRAFFQPGITSTPMPKGSPKSLHKLSLFRSQQGEVTGTQTPEARRSPRIAARDVARTPTPSSPEDTKGEEGEVTGATGSSGSPGDSKDQGTKEDDAAEGLPSNDPEDLKGQEAESGGITGNLPFDDDGW